MAKKVVKGSHLTVTTHENGSVELSWDWEALSRDIATALGTKPQIDLSSMSKDELLEHGKKLGIKLKSSDKKSVLIEKIKANTP